MKIAYHVFGWILVCTACLSAQPSAGTTAFHDAVFGDSGNENLNANSSERNFLGQSKRLFRRTARGERNSGGQWAQ